MMMKGRKVDKKTIISDGFQEKENWTDFFSRDRKKTELDEVSYLIRREKRNINTHIHTLKR